LTTFPTLPTDINKTLLKLFQTSSDKKFNHISEIQQLNNYPEALQIEDKAYGESDEILDLAQTIFQSLVSPKERRAGEFNKVNKSAFNSTTSKFKFFNCGGNHSLKNCKKPRNIERITKNKKA